MRLTCFGEGMASPRMFEVTLMGKQDLEAMDCTTAMVIRETWLLMYVTLEFGKSFGERRKSGKK